MASETPKMLLSMRFRPGLTPAKQCCSPNCDSQSAVALATTAAVQATRVKALSRPCHLGAQKTQSASAAIRW